MEQDSPKYNLIRFILENQGSAIDSENLIFDDAIILHCCQDNMYLYLNLIVNYYSDKEILISRALNFRYRSYRNKKKEENRGCKRTSAKRSSKQINNRNNYLLNDPNMSYVDDERDSALLVLIKSNHCDEKWLNLLLFGIYNCQKKSKRKVLIYQSDLIDAYKKCTFGLKNDRWAKKIIQYAKQTNQMFDKAQIDQAFV